MQADRFTLAARPVEKLGHALGSIPPTRAPLKLTRSTSESSTVRSERLLAYMVAGFMVFWVLFGNWFYYNGGRLLYPRGIGPLAPEIAATRKPV